MDNNQEPAPNDLVLAPQVLPPRQRDKLIKEKLNLAKQPLNYVSENQKPTLINSQTVTSGLSELIINHNNQKEIILTEKQDSSDSSSDEDEEDSYQGQICEEGKQVPEQQQIEAIKALLFKQFKPELKKFKNALLKLRKNDYQAASAQFIDDIDSDIRKLLSVNRSLLFIDENNLKTIGAHELTETEIARAAESISLVPNGKDKLQAKISELAIRTRQFNVMAKLQSMDKKGIITEINSIRADINTKISDKRYDDTNYPTTIKVSNYLKEITPVDDSSFMASINIYLASNCPDWLKDNFSFAAEFVNYWLPLESKDDLQLQNLVEEGFNALIEIADIKSENAISLKREKRDVQSPDISQTPEVPVLLPEPKEKNMVKNSLVEILITELNALKEIYDKILNINPNIHSPQKSHSVLTFFQPAKENVLQNAIGRIENVKSALKEIDASSYSSRHEFEKDLVIDISLAIPVALKANTQFFSSYRDYDCYLQDIYIELSKLIDDEKKGCRSSNGFFAAERDINYEQSLEKLNLKLIALQTNNLRQFANDPKEDYLSSLRLDF